ncbi:MAG: IgGFc-binding protein [Candidatus Kapaibacterium sp.]
MMKLIIGIIITLTFPIFLLSQSADNIGREFVLCFPKNDGSEALDDVLKLTMINYENKSANLILHFSLDGNIIYDTLEPKQTKVIHIPNKYELSAFNNIEKNTLKLVSSADISVIFQSRTHFSSDACLVLPVHSLGSNYVVTNINNRGDVTFARLNIIALYDETVVEINSQLIIDDSDVDLEDNKSFKLNNDEVFVLTANIIDKSDFSGTFISSNKPISVFTSHDRTSIPINHFTQDCIIEHLPPIDKLGDKTIFTLTKFPSYESVIYSKIIAVFDSTLITWNGNDTLISQGEFVDLVSTSSFVVKADKSVLFSQYEQSARVMYAKGDPFLAIIPPIQQWKNNYSFYSSELMDFSEHWINIAIHENALNSIILDGKPVETANITRVEGSDYFAGSVKVQPGFHQIHADSNFSLLVYGYGVIISYGYTGGMKTERLLEKIMDKHPPQFLASIDCEADVTITELNEFDSGIDDIEIVEIDNMIVQFQSFNKGDTIVSLKLTPEDDSHDSYAILRTSDIKGHVKMDTVQLFGFNIDHDFINYYDTLYFNEFRCDSIRLTNHSSAARDFNLYFENNTQISVPPRFGSISLEPGGDTVIPFCVSGNFYGSITDILILSDVCERIYSLPISYSVQNFSTEAESKCETVIEFAVVSDMQSLFKDSNYSPGVLMKIFDLSGRELYSGAPGSMQFRLKSGTYALIIVDKGTIIKRMIVNHE